MARLRGHSGLTDRGLVRGASAPSGAAIGQMWFNTGTGVLYQRTANVDGSSFWLDITSGGIGTSASRGVDFAGTTDPKLTTNGAGLAVGSIYYNITTNKHFVCTDATSNQNGWSGGFIGMGGDVVRDYTYSGTSYRVHKFTSSGSFILDAQKTVDILLIGGGGNSGGTNANGSGGGGAGELFWTTISNLSIGAYSVEVGAGAPISTTTANNGSVTYFDKDRTNMKRVYGGGQGGNFQGNALTGGGGSGGGAGRDRGNTTAAAALKYNAGGHANVGGYCNIGSYGAGGGGGGAGAAGRNTTSAGHGSNSPHFGDHNSYHTTSGGGIGNSTFIGSSAAETTAFLLGALAGTDSSNVATVVGSTGTLYIAAGGGGSVYKTNDTTTARGLKTGSAGGGGDFHLGNGVAGSAGQANTGSGGGGGRHATHSAGGSGVCIIRYVIT